MFEQLIETIKAFSVRTVLRTNIISSPGTAFGSNFSNTSLGNGLRNSSVTDQLSASNLLSTYYLKLQELAQYKVSELTEISLGIYRDYLVEYFNEGSDIVRISDKVPDHERIQARLNKVFKQLNVVNEIRDHIDDYLYYGSYAFKCMWNQEESRYERFNLANPTSVIEIDEGKPFPTSYLVVSRKGTIYEVSPYSIFYIGNANLNLINDINQKYFDDDEDSLINGLGLSGSMPLYYNNSQKIKEYLLKEQLLSLLSIKDLIQPLLLLLRVDNNTAPDEANKLALNVENLINKYVDITSIMGANFSISELIDALINNIRVIPDYNSGMGDMNSIDLSKISNKIQEIRGDQDNTKESILNGLSIPRALYSGESTKWDAIKSSQRLNSKINRFVKDINGSVKLNAIKFHYLMTNEMLDPEDVSSNLFKKTDADYNAEVNNAEIINNVLDQMDRIMSKLKDLPQNEYLDPKAYANYIRQQVLKIDPDLDSSLTDKVVDKFIKSIEDQRGSSESSGGGFGGY